MANFTRRMRVTASSMRAIGTTPSSTSCFRLAMYSLYLLGTMAMSMPALIEIPIAFL